jgi:hypothetical protein
LKQFLACPDTSKTSKKEDIKTKRDEIHYASQPPELHMGAKKRKKKILHLQKKSLKIPKQNKERSKTINQKKKRIKKEK